LPEGSGDIARWAFSRKLKYEANPDQGWFQHWEPFDMLVAPSHYYNACSWVSGSSTAVLVEPWTGLGDIEPVDRTVLAFANHPALHHRAAMRVGEHFLTRVAYLESPPPPEVKVGDPVWDGNVVTRATSPEAAAAAFHPGLRALLQTWGFRGHVELRPGGAVIYVAGVKPSADGYQQMSTIVTQLMSSALGG
jgi:hypothetical protein